MVSDQNPGGQGGPKQCQGKARDGRCTREAKDGERFCHSCRRTIISAIRSQYRGLDARRSTTPPPPPLAKGSRLAEAWYKGEMRDNDDD